MLLPILDYPLCTDTSNWLITENGWWNYCQAMLLIIMEPRILARLLKRNEIVCKGYLKNIVLKVLTKGIPYISHTSQAFGIYSECFRKMSTSLAEHSPYRLYKIFDEGIGWSNKDTRGWYFSHHFKKWVAGTLQKPVNICASTRLQLWLIYLAIDWVGRYDNEPKWFSWETFQWFTPSTWNRLAVKQMLVLFVQ